jgi:hypothetical protein
MAKKKSFGESGDQQKSDSGPMAKVIISKKMGNNIYAYKEAMVRENNVKDFISENKS